MFQNSGNAFLGRTKSACGRLTDLKKLIISPEINIPSPIGFSARLNRLGSLPDWPIGFFAQLARLHIMTDWIDCSKDWSPDRLRCQSDWSIALVRLVPIGCKAASFYDFPAERLITAWHGYHECSMSNTPWAAGLANLTGLRPVRRPPIYYPLPRRTNIGEILITQLWRLF